MLLILALFYHLSTIVVRIESYSCKNYQGHDVDWSPNQISFCFNFFHFMFVAYKLPRLDNHLSQDITDGTAYLYADSNTQHWQMPYHPYNVNHPHSAIGIALGQLFAAQRNTQHFYATYNDQCPGVGFDEFSPDGGHMKGVLVFDQQAGFWMMHSVPQFPFLQSGKYEFAENGKMFGQSFLCISLNSSMLDQIAELLHFADAHLCSHQLPPWLHNHPMKEFLHMQNDDEPDYHSDGSTELNVEDLREVKHLRSRLGQEFFAIYKHPDAHFDLFSHFVAPNLGANLLAHSWLRSSEPVLANGHGQFGVFNIAELRMEFLLLHPHSPSNMESVQFHAQLDHSKWAVSMHPAGHRWVCIGDTNRTQGQLIRGGGTVCFQHPTIGDLFFNAVHRY